MTFITVLGASGCRYDYGDDTASFLINNKLVVDTGWNLVENMLDAGLDPAGFKTVLFTHLHHDHYLALPQFLFYHINAGTNLGELKLAGPPDINNVLKLAADFLQLQKFFGDVDLPECINIGAGGNIQLGGLLIEARQSLHTVDGRLYRVTDTGTGAKIGLTGDTAYEPAAYELFRGCDMLVHECSLGAKHEGDNAYLHASAEDAGTAAAIAGVDRLVLAHYPARLRAECREAAAGKFNGEVLTPVKGDIIYAASKTRIGD